jgi:hypothetical protein
MVYVKIQPARLLKITSRPMKTTTSESTEVARTGRST